MRRILFLFLFGIFLFPLASANFLCGEVLPATDGYQPSWLEVTLSYADNPSQYTSCEVSPDGNKYCCDPHRITSRTWFIGAPFRAEIVSPETGYLASEVFTSSTGQGVDLFPPMQLEKVISVSSPEHSVVVSETLPFVGFFHPDYSSVSILSEEGELFSCTNCTFLSENLSTSFGSHELWVEARSSVAVTFVESFVVHLLSFADLDWQAICSGCQGSRVLPWREVTMTRDITLSHSVSEVTVTEYVPFNWEILETNGGDVRPFSLSHQHIVWSNVSGEDISLQYTVRSPLVFFFPHRYLFRTVLEDYVLDQREVTVSWGFPFFARTHVSSAFNPSPLSRYHVSPSRPLVLYPQNDSLHQLVVYPTRPLRGASFSLSSLPEEGLPSGEILSGAVFDSSFSSDIDSLYMEFLLPSSEEFDFYVLSNGSWVTTFLPSVVTEANNTLYQNSFPPVEGYLLMKTESSSFFDLFG